MIVVRLILNQLLFALSFLVPKKKGLILLGAGLGTRFSGNPKYLYLHLLGESDRAGSFHWLTESDDLVQEFQGRGWPVLSKKTVRGFWFILRAETLVIESGTASGISGHDIGYERLFAGRFRIVQTWHGTPLKKIALDVMRDRKGRVAGLMYALQKWEFQRYALLPVQSEYEKPIYQSAFANSRVEVMGNARNDVLLRPDLCQRDLRRELNLTASTLITYAPTFRDGLTGKVPFTKAGWQKLNAWCEKHDACFLVKKHPFDRQLEIPDALGYVRDVSTEVSDIQELLLVTDVLVTDYSSVSIDFAVTGRSMLFYTYDQQEYQEHRDLYVDLAEALPGPFAKDEDDVLSELQRIVDGEPSPSQAEKTDAFLTRFVTCRDGQSCSRLLAWMDTGH